jgi:cytochrome c-type biogenesis protein CcmH/NrfG
MVPMVILFIAASLLSQPQPARREANRGVALLEQFRFTEAAQAFEAVVAADPESVAGYINLGIAYFNERDFEKSRAALERARALAPENPYVHYNLGLIDKLQGNTEAAAAAFEKVAAIDPSDSMTLYYLGTLYANLGRLEEAEATLRRTLLLSPNNESAHFSLGNVLIRQGHREEGQKELLIFRELKESFPAEAASAGLQYTELGPYAEAVEVSQEPLQRAVPETTREGSVRFVEATAAFGPSLEALPAPAPLPATVPASSYGLPFLRERVLPRLGTGMAFRDLDSDSDPDLLFVREGAPLFFRNQGGTLERAKGTGLPESGHFIGVVVGDVDNDKDGDVYLTGSDGNALLLNDGMGKFTESPDETVRGSGLSVSATFADVDHDGDLDLYVASYASIEPPAGKEALRLPREIPGAPNRLFQNNGNGTFTDIAVSSGTDGGAARSLGALFSDVDDDRDVDFIVINEGSPPFLFSNDRVGTFTESALDVGLALGGRTRGADSGDFDRDGSFDFFFTAEGSQLNALYRGPGRSGLSPDVVSPGLLAAGVPNARYGVQFADLDNDADLDLLVVTNEKDELAAYYENRPSGFERAGSLKAAVEGEGRGLAVADLDSDGDLDVAVSTDRGELAIFRNEGGNQRAWLTVRAQGLRSNLDGLGAKVEVRAGEASLRREVRSSSGYFSQSDLPLHFGLGSADSADYVRFLWPGGVKQVEMDLPGKRAATIEELNRKGTSCPILYAWDGERIRFVTDFLGGSAFGYLLAPGHYNTPDTEETVKMEAFPLALREGSYDVRFVNQLEEVLFYDAASLLVVDHPAEVEVYPDERLMPGPPFPTRKLYAVSGARAPVRAIDHRGKDVTSLIAEKDRLYPGGFELLPFKGYAEEHSLTLDLGSLEEGAQYVLLLYGWVDYADSSANLAASQAGVRLVPPYLEVAGSDGNFTKTLPQMGFPAGLPKTMVVDLDRMVSAKRNRVRITTSMRLYWDRIQIAKLAPAVELSVKELKPSSAELRRLGYPAPYDPDGRKPSLYTYDRILESELWGAHEGDYTRYGDVRPLLEKVDDRYVVTHDGDEVLLRFDGAALEPQSEGRERSYFVIADGFGKDMDLSSAFPDTVEPLPFHGMPSYPYPAEWGRFLDDPLHRQYREEYNSRRVPR